MISIFKRCKKPCLLAFLIAFNVLNAQKVIKKKLPGNGFQFVQIDTKNCFQAEIVSSPGMAIEVEARIEGEYSNDLVIRLEEEGDNIAIGAEFQPSFQDPNDKLSAHKVVSIDLKVKIPNSTDVQVYGTSCNVALRGSFHNLEVVLNDGDCTLNQVRENVLVTTQSGNIQLNILQGQIKAATRYGEIYRDAIPKGRNRYELNTISGNINLIHTK